MAAFIIIFFPGVYTDIKVLFHGCVGVVRGCVGVVRGSVKVVHGCVGVVVCASGGVRE